MATTLTGNNFHQLKQRLYELKHKFVAEHGELALIEVDGEAVGLQDILESVGGHSLFSNQTMVVIRDLATNKAASEQIEQIISSTSETTELIFIEPKIDKRSAYFKVLNRLTTIEEYSELDSSELTAWLVAEAKKHGAKLPFSEAKYLVEKAGENQALLASELGKLITFDKDVSRQNIDLLVVKTPQSKVFDLLDAAFRGQKRRAINLYEEQRQQKIEPQEILAMIAWQLKLIALVKLAGGRPSLQIATDAGVNSYPVTKAQELAKNLSDKQLKQLAEDAYTMDKLLKTKPIDADQALKTYIVSL